MKTILGFLIALALMVSPVIAADTIKLGAFFDLSGRAAFIGTPTKLVAEMVVDKINSEGGINGQMLELTLADTELTRPREPLLPKSSSTKKMLLPSSAQP